MQTNNSSQPYFLQRPNSPKNALGPGSNKNIPLTLSIGANQTSSNLLPKYKTQDNTSTITTAQSHPDQPYLSLEKLQQDLRASTKENSILKEENSQLRRELLRVRREPNFENSRSMEKLSLSPDFSDLRGTIKKEIGQIRDLRAKVESLSSQCRLYEETVEKMEERIRRLGIENNKKRGQIQELQSQLVRLDMLKDKMNGVMRLYNDLQGKFNAEQLEWMRWKQNWLAQKECYLDRIRELEKIVDRMHR